MCGSSLSNAPKWAGIFGITYDGPLTSSGWKMLANANFQYVAPRRTSTLAVDVLSNVAGSPLVTGILPFDIQDSSQKINLRLGFTTPNDMFTIEFWGTNVTNERIRTVTFNTPLRGGAGARDRSAFVEEPRMYGVTGRVKF